MTENQKKLLKAIEVAKQNDIKRRKKILSEMTEFWKYNRHPITSFKPRT